MPLAADSGAGTSHEPRLRKRHNSSAKSDTLSPNRVIELSHDFITLRGVVGVRPDPTTLNLSPNVTGDASMTPMTPCDESTGY
ncbi:unnamed protein product [Euphydryas editha]|uniref:Uncharacterized protein n=1 Tax=Euphydryas editha TaxID=104508 RepID=A0AAU9UMP2_EUPED|nr:unnamed protein product [Euphydryas editha]